jgi:hypothetical protein
MGVVALLSVLAAGSPTKAALISQDLFIPGDGKITLDTTTSLQWLDVTETKGCSVNQVLAGQAGQINWIAIGWRYATLAEVCGFSGPFTGPTTGCGGPVGPWSNSGIAELQIFIGITTTQLGTAGIEFLTEGFFSSGRASIIRASDNVSAAAVVSEFNFDPNQVRPGYGSFLVRVPEASNALLTLASVLGGVWRFFRGHSRSRV